MSTENLSEPPTEGRVVVNTTHGPINIDLWPKEAPLAVFNFVQLCMDGYYDNIIFHRIIKNFRIETGDPTGTGTGGGRVPTGPPSNMSSTPASSSATRAWLPVLAKASPPPLMLANSSSLSTSARGSMKNILSSGRLRRTLLTLFLRLGRSIPMRVIGPSTPPRYYLLRYIKNQPPRDHCLASMQH